jgi:hypothetical protein
VLYDTCNRQILKNLEIVTLLKWRAKGKENKLSGCSIDKFPILLFFQARMGIMSTTKISNLMELPPTVLIDDNGNREIYYPAPLLELWTKSTQPPHDSPSGEI